MDQVLGLDAVEINVETGPSLGLNLESRSQHRDRPKPKTLGLRVLFIGLLHVTLQ